MQCNICKEECDGSFTINGNKACRNCYQKPFQIKQDPIKIIETLLENSEARSTELECSQFSYELGLEDVLMHLKGLND